MKNKGKNKFFVVFALILLLAFTAITGVSYQFGDNITTYIKGVDSIRWGIDIQGGVDATFTPPENIDATDEELSAAESIIKLRLIDLNITDYEVYTDFANQRIIVRFPWKSGETSFNPEEAIKEIGATAMLQFVEGKEVDSDGNPTGTVVLTGKDVVSAQASYDDSSGNVSYLVNLKLSEEGAKKFEAATAKLYPVNGQISIWLDDTMISAPSVGAVITNGIASISSPNFTAEEVTDLANKINAGALPFALVTDNYNTISPTLGASAKDAMMLAGAIALLLVCLYMIVVYRVPGAVASIALIGQLAGSIAAISGYFGVFPSFTLTLPGIAGIILAIGFGVDANVITTERLKEELDNGKSINAAMTSAFKNGFSAILDGNVTIIIVSIILMGAFGPPTNIFAKMLSPILQFFPSAITGSIYSFGYTLLVGVIMNFIFGVFASRTMLKAISKFKGMDKKWLYGGAKDVE